FVEYFCVGMADAFARGRARAEEASRGGPADQGPALRGLSPQQRNALGLFRRSRVVTSKDVAAYFRMKRRTASLLCARWVREGFLAMENPSTKGRTYRLAERYEALVIGR
ncbi:MAG: MarR family transcriptional regulator, partial [Zavarzinella sp.]|nr:MarR family transcriptional regulator [Zavarzinella sp.]